MTELCCEYLSMWCIWLYVIIMSPTRFRMNPHSIACLNAKELLARSRCHIWSLSDSNEIQTQRVWILWFNHLAKLAKWLTCVMSTYLYGALDLYLKFKWQQQDLNPQIWCLLQARTSLTFRQTKEWIHTKSCLWHDSNIQSNAPYR